MDSKFCGPLFPNLIFCDLTSLFLKIIAYRVSKYNSDTGLWQYYSNCDSMYTPAEMHCSKGKGFELLKIVMSVHKIAWCQFTKSVLSFLSSWEWTDLQSTAIWLGILMGILGLADCSQYLCQKRGKIPVEMKISLLKWKRPLRSH